MSRVRIGKNLLMFAFVRNVAQEPNIQISLQIDGRQRNLNRVRTEPIGKVLTRLQSDFSAQQKGDGRKSKKTAKQPPTPPSVLDVKLLNSVGDCIDQNTPNEVAWVSGNHLAAGTTLYTILVNIPQIKALSVSGVPMAGTPLVPVVELEFASLKDCCWLWSRVQNGSKLSLATTFVYTPTASDVGAVLSVECCSKLPEGCLSLGDMEVDNDEDAASNETSIADFKPSLLSTTTAKVVPSLVFPFELRCVEFARPAPSLESIRVVSYNILADIYATSEFAMKKLYPYCEPTALDRHYRKQLLAKELLLYDGDIVCLQEVGIRVFEEYFKPLFDFCGFDSWYLNKAGEAKEGEAFLYRRSRFDLRSTEALSVRSVVSGECDLHPEMTKVFCENETLKRALSKITTVGQFTVLEDKAKKKPGEPPHLVCVVNTHLFYYPNAHHVRILTAALFVHHAKLILDRMDPTARTAVIFAGDLNATPDHAMEELMCGGLVPAHHPDWADGAEFSWDRDEDDDAVEVAATPKEKPPTATPAASPPTTSAERTTPSSAAASPASYVRLDLRQPIRFTNACGALPYTNFTSGFVDTLDYIYVDSTRFAVCGAAGVPAREVVTAHTALPSRVFPSDHVSIACDITWV